MLKELGWYFDDNRFAAMAAELDDSVRQYAKAKAAGNGEQTLSPLREAARTRFEAHCVLSGLRDEKARYVNIDAEFFDGNRLDEQALDSFIKNIIKGHGYQRILWTYMGTTGNFTVISKGEMALNGLRYEDYLPLAYRKETPVNKPVEKKPGGGAVPLYIYGDGSISQEYSKEKARLEFDRLEDKSGIDWKKGYDPNSGVKKDGWYGTFDKEGNWVRVEAKRGIAAESGDPRPQPVRIIKDGGVVVLYDPGNRLVNSGETAYITETGEPYGGLELDEEGTQEELDRQMKVLGVTGIDAVGTGVVGAGLEQYRKLLGEKASPGLYLLDRAATGALKKRQRERAEALETEAAGIALEGSIRVARWYGAEGKELERVLGEGSVTVPLSPVNKDDAVFFALTEAERERITGYAPEDEVRYGAILSNLFVSWDEYASSGKTKGEMAKLVSDTLEGNRNGEAIQTAVSLGSIINGPEETNAAKDVQVERTGIPGVFTEIEPVNFFGQSERAAYLNQLEKKRVLPKGGAALAEEALGKSLPGIAPEQEEAANKGLTRALSQYKEIAASTGMPAGEVVGAVIAKVNGETVPALGKPVYYELPVDKLCREAGKRNNQRREVRLDKQADEVEIVIGGVGGAGLHEAGFDKKSLRERYGYGEKEAEEAEDFLRGIRAASPAAVAELLPEIKRVVNEQAGNGAGGLRAGVLGILDKHPGTGYNVASEAGWSAYRESPRYSGISKTAVAGLLAGSRGAGAADRAHPGVAAIEPRYRSVAGVVPLVRSRPRGMPEAIMPGPMAREKASGSAAPVEHVAEIGAARAGTMPVLPATASPAPAANAGEERREARHTARDRELERLRKIEANYEKDRAA
jgi:hypothetical protein